MDTQCSATQLQFHPFGRRLVTGRFDGGCMSSDGGSLLLREVDQRIGLLERLAGCFVDHRNPSSVEHDVRTLLAQRVYALALGYEDLNDHDELRRDALLSAGGGQGGSDGRGPGAGARPGRRVGELEHAEPSGAGRSRDGGGASLQAHRGAAGGARRLAGRVVYGVARQGAARDLAGPPTRRTIRCMARRRAASTTVTTTATATCRCTSSAADICCVRGCGRRTGTPRRARRRNWNGSSGNCAGIGPGRASSSAVTRASVAMRS